MTKGTAVSDIYIHGRTHMVFGCYGKEVLPWIMYASKAGVHKCTRMSTNGDTELPLAVSEKRNGRYGIKRMYSRISTQLMPG